jgi:hypothetical protein
MHPELSFGNKAPQNWCRTGEQTGHSSAELAGDYQVVAATLEGKKKHPRRWLPCAPFMDALPIHETTGICPIAQNPGVSCGTCGHDSHCHAAGRRTALGMSRLDEMERETVFQRAEGRTDGGAAEILKLLAPFPVKARLPFTWSELKWKIFSVRSRAAWQPGDNFEVVIQLRAATRTHLTTGWTIVVASTIIDERVT